MKCWVKINAGSGLPILQQCSRSASGNMCIHLHEISTLATVLPQPMFTLYDEIVIIFVSDNHKATADMFKWTPFLVHRGHILHALNWLTLVGRFKFFSTIYSEKCCLFFRHFSLKKVVKNSKDFHYCVSLR
jgi:hypothetical protein